jgi:hypothetical protein
MKKCNCGFKKKYEDLLKKYKTPPNIKFLKNDFKKKIKKLQLRQNKNVNVIIGTKPNKHMQDLLLGHERFDDGSITIHYKDDVWLSTVLRDIGIFDSISSAKGAGWHKKATQGFNDEIVVIAKIPHRICIYKDIK